MDIPSLPRCKADDEDMEKLHSAARKGNVEVVSRLINGGIHHSIPNKFGCTALHLACKHNHVSIIQELGEKQVALGAWHGWFAIHLAVITGNVSLLDELCYAVERHSGNDFNSFINQAAEQEITDIQGKVLDETTSLLAPLHLSVILNNINVTKKLLEKGAAVTLRDKLGKSPLMYALHYADEAMVKVLLAQHTTVHVQDKKGANVLHHALRSDRDDMCALLLQAVRTESSESINSFLVAEDDGKVSPVMLMIETGKVSLLASCVEFLDSFSFQQMKFHDARTVHPERIHWCLPHNPSQFDPDVHLTSEGRKDAVIRILQSRLDEVNTDAFERKPKRQPITLAPSSPGNRTRGMSTDIRK
eukprot:TRINITY_DN8225_c2_g1_i1.p1 TRINITY_DN8225_c2_g1~~TRINITY_DN8225_c2_g1_i1.p1  ORF type:complete len:385 (+),score=105.87 TRINITY_DN8225_c2_g1_i1:78-1157(+)